MSRKFNHLILILIIIISLLVIQFGTTVKLKAIILALGLILMILLTYFFTKEMEKEQEQTILDLEKKAEKKHKESEENLVQLISSIPSGLVYINQKGEFDISNKKFDSILNIDATNVYDSRIDGDFRQMLLDAFLNEKQFIRQQKFSDIDYQVLAVPMLKNDRYNGCMIILQDITRLLEGERLQQKFIANASYELKNPIDSISELSKLINDSDNDLDEASRLDYLAQIQIEGARLEKIIEKLLLRSRLMEDKLHLEKTEFNLRQFFEGLIYEKRRSLHTSNIEVVLNCPSDVKIVGDHFRLSQVFDNLFNNSINYSKEGKIKIDCNITSRNWNINFCDTGAGIDENVLPHIFDRFYRGDESEQRYSGKAGLGLAISKSIIEAHGGEINVESIKGEGTCFIINIDPNENLY